MKILISMAGKSEGCQTRLRHINGQLFLHLTDQSSFRPLMRLNLAARKLPQARKRFPFRPLGNQHPAIGINQGNRCNKKDAH